MARYITQQLFNMCAVSAAKISAASGKPVAAVAQQLAATYRDSYKDTELAQDIAVAAEQVSTFIGKSLSPDKLIGNLNQLQFCIKYYQPSGKRWPMKLFSGALFNKSSRQIKDKSKQCLANIATYHLLVLNSAIPLMPKGWAL